MADIKASKPTTSDGLQYHTHTGKGDVARLGLLVGAPGRVKIIADKFLRDCRWFKNEHRGLYAVTGYYKDIEVTVATTGMGGSSTGIVLPELTQSGMELGIRVGTCGSLKKKSKCGDSVIVTSAVGYDGTSTVYAPAEFPANSDYRVVFALVEAARRLFPGKYHVGEECTTADFYNGQGRPDLNGNITKEMLDRHEMVMNLGVVCYSMEAATINKWGKYQAKGMPTGAINAIVANRHTEEFAVLGEEQAAEIALEALLWLNSDPDTQAAMAKIRRKD